MEKEGPSVEARNSNKDGEEGTKKKKKKKGAGKK